MGSLQRFRWNELSHRYAPSILERLFLTSFAFAELTNKQNYFFGPLIYHSVSHNPSVLVWCLIFSPYNIRSTSYERPCPVSPAQWQDSRMQCRSCELEPVISKDSTKPYFVEIVGWPSVENTTRRLQYSSWFITISFCPSGSYSIVYFRNCDRFRHNFPFRVWGDIAVHTMFISQYT